MIRIIQAEFKKLKRFHILIVGFIGMAFPAVLAIFTQAVASAGVDVHFDFEALFNASIWNSVTIFMPISFTLIGGYIINREYRDDTLKNIFPIPMSFRKLITGKLLTMGILSLFFGLYSFLVTILIGEIFSLQGLNMSLLLQAFLQTMGLSLAVYLAVMPMIAYSAKREDVYLGTVVVAFVLGYSAMFIKDPLLRSLYPMLAGFRIVRFDTSSFMNTNEAAHLSLSFLSLALSVLITIFILMNLKPEKERKAKKEFRRKRRI